MGEWRKGYGDMSIEKIVSVEGRLMVRLVLMSLRNDKK